MTGAIRQSRRLRALRRGKGPLTGRDAARGKEYGMTSGAFTPKAYIKEGCPFSLKFLIFMAEAGLLGDIEIVRVDPNDAHFEADKSRLSERLGKAATFPTVETELGKFMSDSDALIEHYARQHGFNVAALPLLSFYKETVFPQIIEAHNSKPTA
jgi:hypothetical protein